MLGLLFFIIIIIIGGAVRVFYVHKEVQQAQARAQAHNLIRTKIIVEYKEDSLKKMCDEVALLAQEYELNLNSMELEDLAYKCVFSENTKIFKKIEKAKAEEAARIAKEKAKEKAKAAARWEREGDIVTDKVKKLMWQDDIEAKTTEKKWSDAVAYCEDLRLGGYDDWRLPTYDELLGIIDYKRYGPAIEKYSFNNVVSTDYWSSSEYVGDATEAWHVNFYSGNTGCYDKSFELYVRCVRGRQ